jgi:hypothetical protein
MSTWHFSHPVRWSARTSPRGGYAIFVEPDSLINASLPEYSLPSPELIAMGVSIAKLDILTTDYVNRKPRRSYATAVENYLTLTIRIVSH